MTTITFIRHAQSEYNKEGKRICGRIDCNITNEGVEESKNIFNKNETFDIYYCSPLKRTKQTLKAINQEANPIVDERLNEIDTGEWTGKLKKEIENSLDRKEMELYKIGEYQIPNGETKKQVEERVNSFIKEIFEKYTNNEKILCVTSNGIIRTIKKKLKYTSKNIQTENLEMIKITKKDLKG